MDQPLIIGGIIGLATIVIASLIALGIQNRLLNQALTLQNAWQRAQETHLDWWEKQLEARIEQLHKEWQEWEYKDTSRIDSLSTLHENANARLAIEHELSRLPYIEDVPVEVSPDGKRQHNLPNWRAPFLQRANLSGRDLSHRFFGRADLREAQLTNTSFFMSDLSGASFVGADLSGAVLSGADLSGADLRGANLQNASMEVADLHNAILIGANLLGARHLTQEQILSTIFDNTTQFDTDIDFTIPRIRSVRTSSPLPAPTRSKAIAASTLREVPEKLVGERDLFAPETPLPGELSDESSIIEVSASASSVLIESTDVPVTPSENLTVTTETEQGELANPLDNSTTTFSENGTDEELAEQMKEFAALSITYNEAHNSTPTSDTLQAMTNESAVPFDTAMEKPKYNGKKRTKVN